MSIWRQGARKSKMREPKNPHGGARVGAGRKRPAPDQRKIIRSVYISVENDRFILSQRIDDEPYSKTLDRVLSALREPIFVEDIRND